jgi:hypothetical protein
MLPANRQNQLNSKSLPRQKCPQPPSRDLRGHPTQGLQLSERGDLGDFPGVPLSEGLSQCVGDVGFGNALGSEFPCETGWAHGMTMGPSTGPRLGIRSVVKVSSGRESRYHRTDLIRAIAAPRQALPDLLCGQGPHTQEFDRDVPRVRTPYRVSLSPPLPRPHQIPRPSSTLPALDAARALRLY